MQKEAAEGRKITLGSCGNLPLLARCLHVANTLLTNVQQRKSGEVGLTGFSKSDIGTIIEHIDDYYQQKAICLMPYVLKRGIQIGKHIDHKNRAKHTVTFAAPISINGTRGNMAVVVNRNRNRAYSERVLLPDGSVFIFSKNKETPEGIYQGVLKDESLADTTAGVSIDSISNSAKKINRESKIISAESKIISAEQDADTLKQKQPDIILENDPAWADDRTWIRSAKDIKTFSEVTTPAVIEDGYTPDYTGEDMRKAFESGYVTVYSSMRIRPGIFVTPSAMEARDYGGGQTPFSKRVKITDVAWTDEGQGQYAPVKADVGTFSDNKDIRLSLQIGSETEDTVKNMNKEKTIKAIRPTRRLISGTANIPNGFIHSVTDINSPVNAKINHVTKTQQFRRWFGDWIKSPESISPELLNEDGTPRIFYHGTKSYGFTVFNEFTAFNEDAPIFLTSSFEAASTYSRVKENPANVDYTDVRKIYAEEALSNNEKNDFVRAYSLKNIKIADVRPYGAPLPEEGLSGTNTSAIHRIADLYIFVKQNDKDFKTGKDVDTELLNEDGTPRIRNMNPADRRKQRAFFFTRYSTPYSP